MSHNRTPGQLNDTTYLIDGTHNGITGAHGLFLLKSGDGGTCLIDGGTKNSAPVIKKTLEEYGAWPPDKLIMTHSHWDHSQGIPFLMEEAEKAEKPIEFYASDKAAPYLADPSYNIAFGEENAPFLNLPEALSVSGGDTIEVGTGLTLEVVETPGHMVDHISLFNPGDKTIFTGDAMGMKWTDGLWVVNANSDYFDPDAFFGSVERVKKTGFKNICMAHYGCLSGAEAAGYLDEYIEMYHRWFEIMDENQDHLTDVPYMTARIFEGAYSHIPEKFLGLLKEPMEENVGYATMAYARKLAG